MIKLYLVTGYGPEAPTQGMPELPVCCGMDSQGVGHDPDDYSPANEALPSIGPHFKGGDYKWWDDRDSNPRTRRDWFTASLL